MSPGGSGSHNANSVPPPNTQDGVSSAGTKKNVRKKSVNKKLTEYLRLGGNVRPVIEILPGLTVPVRPWAKEYSTEIGVIVRQHAPLCCHTWKEVKKHSTYQTLFEQVLKRFNMDFSQPHVVSAVDGHLKKLFKEYRHDLHSHYLSLPDNVDKSRHPKEDVAQDKWASLCVWWEGEEFQKKSTTNKRSRNKLEVLHRGGAKNFSRHRFDLTNPETNEQPNDIELYRFTHHNLEKAGLLLARKKIMIEWWRCLLSPPKKEVSL